MKLENCGKTKGSAAEAGLRGGGKGENILISCHLVLLMCEICLFVKLEKSGQTWGSIISLPKK